MWLTDNSDPGRGELYVGVTSLLLRQWQSQTRETVEHVRSVRRERRFVLPPSLSRSHGATGFGSGPTGKAALAEALFAGATNSALDLTEADVSALFAPLDRRQNRPAA